MAGTALKILLAIISIIIGTGVTLFFDSIIPGTDQLTLIAIAVVMILATYVSFHFMSKGKG
jgi:hypothetical protein